MLINQAKEPFQLIGRIGFCYPNLELVPLICYRWRCLVKADCSALYDLTMWCPLVFRRIIRFGFWTLHPIGKAKSTLGKNDISIFRQKWLFGQKDFLIFCLFGQKYFWWFDTFNILLILNSSVKGRGPIPYKF